MRIKSFIAVAAMVSACVLAGGCDFLRKVAGRPTSSQIEAAVEQRAEQQRLAEAAERDSIRRAEEAAAEAARLEAEAQTQVVADKAQPQERYYVVVGSYREPRHAERKKKKMEAAGCKAVVARVRGLHVVAVCPSATREEALRTRSRLIRRGLCPEAGWILDLDK